MGCSTKTGAVSALHRLLYQPRILRGTMGTAGLPFWRRGATPELDQTLLKIVWLRCCLRDLQAHAPGMLVRAAGSACGLAPTAEQHFATTLFTTASF